MALYRALLHLLPRDRRRRHGADMAVVFGDLAAEARRADGGRRAVAALWIAEAAGLLRFSWREWTGRVGERLRAAIDVLVGREPGPPLGAEIRWAWRALRARGWRGVLVVGLLAIAMAANAIVFAAADSFVFNRVPYRDADRLVEIGTPSRFGWRPSIWPELTPVWRHQRDVFSDFQAHTYAGQAYLSGGDDPRYVSVESVTPGLFEMLGARPIRGRSFVPDDVRPGAEPVAIMAEDAAAQEFGDARIAVGRTLTLSDTSVRIVGVMATAFRFPSGQERVWRPLDLMTMRDRSAVTPLGRLAAGLSLETASRAVGDRAPALRSFAKPGHQKFPDPARQEARPIRPSLVDPQLKRLFGLLVAAAACLLLVACANVANLELGAAVARTRVMAVQLALGAPKRALVRAVLIEGAMLIAGATLTALVATWQTTKFIAAHLPATVTSVLPNPIDVHVRTIVFMAAIAGVTWLLASLPVALAATRADVLDAIKTDARTLSTSRGGVRLRHVLTAAEVALTVVLLIGAGLSVRTYVNLLNLPTGFDTARAFAVDVRPKPGSSETDATIQGRILGALRARPDVMAVSVADSMPPTMSGGGSISSDLKVGAEPTPRQQVTLAGVHADADYFRALGLPLLGGRSFQPGDAPEMVVVDEVFAKRFWPNGDAVGSTFRLTGGRFGARDDMLVVGVSAHLRTDRDSVAEPSTSFFPVYMQTRPTDRYVPLSFVVRANDGTPVDSLEAMLRALEPGARIRVERMADRYAATFADEQLASSIMSAFGGLAFIVAAAGVYGVMAFLVAARTREIGIRMALGADRGAVRSLVLKSSLPPVLAGAAVGLLGAAVAMHWVRSLFFGVNGVTPVTFAGVGFLVVLTALAATWQPARQAGRVDPSRLLRE